MQNWIAGAMLVLGVLLVLAGAAVMVAKALGAAPSTEAADQTEPAPGRPARLIGAVRRLPAWIQLISWGILLLVLAAITAGAWSFELSIKAGVS
jgi:Flp pilus assembly protein CpaB